MENPGVVKATEQIGTRNRLAQLHAIDQRVNREREPFGSSLDNLSEAVRAELAPIASVLERRLSAIHNSSSNREEDGMTKYRLPVMCTFLSFALVSLADAQSLGIAALAEEINTLKAVVQSQDMRIEILERELNALKARLTDTSSQSSDSRPRSAEDGWRNPDNWIRVKERMSEQQVIAILGEPTKRERHTRSARTLYYEGEVQGSYVSGHVDIYENQVSGGSVSPPVFNP